jgi:uncharacterized protein (DUF1800 family)
MSDRFESREALAAKVEWEGGVMEAVDYGIKAEEMPDEELRALWADLQVKYKAADEVSSKINALLEDWL